MTTTKVAQYLPREVHEADARAATEAWKDPIAQKRRDDAAIARRWCAGDDYECVNRATWTDEDTGLRYCAEHAK